MFEDLNISEDLKEKLEKSIKNQLELYSKMVDYDEKEFIAEFVNDEFISTIAQMYVDFFDENQLDELLMLQDHPLIPKMIKFQQKLNPIVLEKLMKWVEKEEEKEVWEV